ncbi:MAG: hypothetical protein Q8O93_04610 [bacterium]|nr:hypothetical protein [bacterium]
MNEENSTNQAEEIKKLLEQNQRLLEQISRQTGYIKNYVFWAKVAGALKLLLIAVPIVLGFIYLPPLLEGLIGQYQDLLGLQSSAGSLNINNFDINSVKEMLNQ